MTMEPTDREFNGWNWEDGYLILRVNGWLTAIVSSGAAYGPDMWMAQVLYPATAYAQSGPLKGPFTLGEAKSYVEGTLGMVQSLAVAVSEIATQAFQMKEELVVSKSTDCDGGCCYNALKDECVNAECDCHVRKDLLRLAGYELEEKS